MKKNFWKTVAAIVLVAACVLSLSRVPVTKAMDMDPGDPIPTIPQETVPQETTPEETVPETIPEETTPPATEPQHQHSYKSVVTEPTCLEKGYTTHTCECGDSFVDTYVDALGHDMGEWYTTKEAAVDVVGEKRRDCSRCDYFETDVIPAKEEEIHLHDWVTTTVAATCAEDGYTHTECSTCGEVAKHEVIAKHSNHSHYHAEHKDPEVGVQGYDKYVCSVCGDTYYVYIDALPEEGKEGCWNLD